MNAHHLYRRAFEVSQIAAVNGDIAMFRAWWRNAKQWHRRARFQVVNGSVT